MPTESFAVTRFTWANAVSASRLLLIAPCAYTIALGHWGIAAVLFTIAVATDMSDGIIARRRNEVTTFGGLLDHGSDALFVTVTLGALALAQLVPAPLPVLVIAAFAQYVWDSKALSGAPLRTSLLGRWNGIGYYVLVGIVVIGHALALEWLVSMAIPVVGWLLVATTLLSMADRGLTLWRLRRR